MFSLLSVLIHIINSIFSGVYTSQFLRSKQNKKATFILWTLTYFVVQMVIFEVIQSRYPFNDVVSAIINVLLLWGCNVFSIAKVHLGNYLCALAL